MKVRGAVIGAGRVASQHLIPAYKRLKSVEIIGVCDSNHARANKLARRFQIPAVYTDYSDLLKTERVDFIDVCTPVFTHMQICSDALNAGVSVLVEKPLCLTSTEADVLKRISDSQGASVCVVHNYRFLGPVRKAQQLIRDGRIGRITTTVGLIRSTPLLHLSKWTWDETKSGGIFFEAALHLADLQVLFCGEHRRVIGFSCKRDEEFGFVQAFQALIEYKSGVIGTLDVDFCSTNASGELDVSGSAGNIRLLFFPPGMWQSQGFLTPIARTVGEANRVISYLLATALGRYGADYHVQLIRKFVESVQQRTSPPVSITEAEPTIRLLQELRERASMVDR